MNATYSLVTALPQPLGRWWRTALILAAMLIILTAIAVADDCL